MRFFAIKHIHSCFASVSSSDEFVSKEISEKLFDFYRKDLESKVSEKYQISYFYMEADEHYYKIGLKGDAFGDRPPTEEFKEYVDNFCELYGFERKRGTFLDDCLTQIYADEDAASLEKRKAEGYVIPEWNKDLKPADYHGGFSEGFFNVHEGYVENYLIGGGCHGYIGHSVRKPELDGFIEELFSTSFPNGQDVLAWFVCSRNGRHFGDSLEGFDFAEQQEYIQSKIKGLYENARQAIATEGF